MDLKSTSWVTLQGLILFCSLHIRQVKQLFTSFFLAAERPNNEYVWYEKKHQIFVKEKKKKSKRTSNVIYTLKKIERGQIAEL